MRKTSAHKLHKALAALIAVCVLLGLLPLPALAQDGETGAAAGLGTDSPLSSNNQGGNQYINAKRWTTPVKSYLYSSGEGGLTRVEYDGASKLVFVEDYDSGFNFLSGRSIAPELPIWGGFFAGSEYNFIISGQMNPDESDSVEVIRVVKYGKDWQRLGSYSLYGGNTKEPFGAGSLRCAEYNGELFIHTCHSMYKSSDGRNHQASMSLRIRESDMSPLGGNYKVAYTPYGYTSHSFNQFLLIDQAGRFVTMDHGDAYPRGLVINRKPVNELIYGYTDVDYDPPYGCGSQENVILAIPGQTGDNDTGVCLGGFAETYSHYMTAYSYDEEGTGGGEYYTYLAFTDKSSLRWTDNVRLSLPESANASTPMLVSTGLDGGWILWNSEGEDGEISLHYTRYHDDGFDGNNTAEGVSLSDCQPIVTGGKAVWYTTYNGLPTFYRLDDNGLETFCGVSFSQEGETAFQQVTGPDGKLPGLPQEPARDGYEFAGWYTAPEGGEQVAADTVFRRSCTVYARWLPAMRFADVSADDWFYPSVRSAFQHGLMGGVSSSRFDPQGTTSRAMIATILYRMAGSPQDYFWAHFQDVAPGDWYYEAVGWASAHELVNGYSYWSFGPGDPITREQLAVMLYRFAESPDTSGSALSFPDWDRVSPYAREAMSWAADNQLITGKAGRLDPRGRATRAETAAILTRFCEYLESQDNGQ